MAIDLIVPCTKRKRIPPNGQLIFSSLQHATAPLLALDWLERAERSTQKVLVRDLYAGAGWSHAISAFEAARNLTGSGGDQSRLFVVSAGLGLVMATDVVTSYEATFAAGANQVADRILEEGSTALRHQLWWASLNSLRVKTTTPIAGQMERRRPCVIVGSPVYLSAISNDVAALASTRDVDSLFILSVGTALGRFPAAVRPFVLPIGTAIERQLRGPRATIHQRAAFWLLSYVIPETGWNRARVDGQIAAMLRRCSDLPDSYAVKRLRLTDGEIIQWLRERCVDPQRLREGHLLRLFRQTGLACEQARFARLCRCLEQARQAAHPL